MGFCEDFFVFWLFWGSQEGETQNSAVKISHDFH